MLISMATASILKTIDELAVRGKIVDGVYEYAEFTYGINNFKVVADYYENGARIGSAVFKNGELYDAYQHDSECIYPSITLYRASVVKLHQLIAVALIPGAYNLLVDLESDNVVNHKTIEKACVDYKARLKKFKAQSRAFLSGNGALPDSSLVAEGYTVPCDVRDLEICSQAENIAHGYFIRTFKLYGVQISAHDVDDLKRCLIDKDRVTTVADIYLHAGVKGLRKVFDI